MSLRHHAAAAEEGESAAGGLESFGRMCPRIAAGATAVPLPLSATGLDRRRLWLVTELPPVQGGGGGGVRVRCLSDGGAAGVRPLHARDP